MSLDIVQRENRPITRRQLGDSLVQGNAVNHWHGVWVLGSHHDLHGNFALFSCLFEPHSPLPKVHEHLVKSQPMEPGSERRLATKATDFAKELRSEEHTSELQSP